MTNLFHLDNFRSRPISDLIQDQLVLTHLLIILLIKWIGTI